MRALLAVPLAGTALTLSFLLSVAPSSAATSRCDEKIDARDAHLACTYTTKQARERVTKNAPTKKYRYTLVCTYDPTRVCTSLVKCYDEEKNTYQMEEATIGQENWTHVAYLCLDDESEVTEGVTEVEVRRAFAEFTWPEATLMIQPPDGETLVNLPTHLPHPRHGRPVPHRHASRSTDRDRSHPHRLDLALGPAR